MAKKSTSRKRVSVRAEAAIRVKLREQEVKREEEQIARAMLDYDQRLGFIKWSAMRLYGKMSSDSIADQLLCLDYLENLIKHGSFKAPEVRK